MEIESLGRARRIIIGKDSTTIISDANKREVLARCEQLRRQLETSDSTYEKEKIQERLAKLSGGVALIKVGAATENPRRPLLSHDHFTPCSKMRWEVLPLSIARRWYSASSTTSSRNPFHFCVLGGGGESAADTSRC